MTLNLDHVVKKFGGFTAVNDVTLEIPEKQMFGLLGSNGAGKTTTFRMILGLLDPTGGKISWDGQSINYQASNVIGYLPEERGLYPKLKVRDQLVYLGRLRGMKKPDILNELEAWLKTFNVPEYMDKKVEELSKGNQQKIQFIAAVIHRPKLVILDEPFSGLDPVNHELMKSVVMDMNKAGTSIVFSSHRMEDVEELCEYLCILHQGQTVVNGSLKEVKQSFGKKNVVVDADFGLDDLQNVEGVLQLDKGPNGVCLQVKNESVSQEIFNRIANRGFIRKFELEEPSLNDIFIEKVGEAYE